MVMMMMVWRWLKEVVMVGGVKGLLNKAGCGRHDG